ncbi:MAG: ABC transporter permease [Clostridia bacterium]|nr:ABC transporter permease [Clostridia bacterium]
MNAIRDAFHRHRFLFTELVKRDFKKKYKRTYLGMIWSLLSPLLSLSVMYLVFSNIFRSSIENYLIYLFCGNVVWTYFSDATNGGMASLMDNANIFSKINVPKYLFLFSRNLSSLINFGMTFIVFLIFCVATGVDFGFHFFLLIIPILCLIVFNIGLGLILSAMFVFFRDVQYLWSVFLTLLMYMSAIFYNPATIELFGVSADKLLMLNPVYTIIKYFRLIVLDGVIPNWQHHLLMLGYALLALTVGALIYKKKNHKFLYYI